MAKYQFNPAGVALFMLLCLLVPSISAESASFVYCNRKDYAVKVSGVDINPYPVVRGKEATFSINATTAESLSEGKLLIDVSYFGWHIQTVTRDLCTETYCPAVGDFMISHTQVLPGYTPPGSYSLTMTLRNGKDQLTNLTCIGFDFRVSFIASDGVADS